MTRVLITGTNRGIGLELARQYASQPGNRVFAACRNPDEAADLKALSRSKPDNVSVIPLEVTDAASIAGVVKEISCKVDGLDMLINNAAVNPPGSQQDFTTISADVMLKTLHINAVAPLMLAQACFPLLLKGMTPRIVNISSDMGSIAQRYYSGDHAYGTSKAALNMLTRGMALELRSQEIIVISLDPGWVRTDMGGGDAELSPAESAQGIVRVVSALTMKDTGCFLRWNGDTLPW